MLILSRKAGEIICIGESIRIHILGLHGQQVRVGIAAPDEISVHRLEVYERILKEQQADEVLKNTGEVKV